MSPHDSFASYVVDPAVLDDVARQFALQLEDTHRAHASSRPLSEGYEFVGVRGQLQFAMNYKLPFDFERRPGGDGGIDFFVPIRFRLDVKAARKPYHLIVERGKIDADIYVLAKFVDGVPPEFVCWDWALNIARWPTRDFGYGIINHYRKASICRQMPELEARLMRLR